MNCLRLMEGHDKSKVTNFFIRSAHSSDNALYWHAELTKVGIPLALQIGSAFISAIPNSGFAGDLKMSKDSAKQYFAIRPLDAQNVTPTRHGPLAAANAHARPVHTLSLSSATRDYARAVEANLFDRVTARDLEAWAAAMGPWIWAWQRARRLADQPPWRASTIAEERDERTRANLHMLQDIAGWEKALANLDAQARRARLYDRPVPAPLALPTPVADAIRAKRQAALERATARRGGGSGSGGAPALTPDGGLGHAPKPR